MLWRRFFFWRITYIDTRNYKFTWLASSIIFRFSSLSNDSKTTANIHRIWTEQKLYWFNVEKMNAWNGTANVHSAHLYNIHKHYWISITFQLNIIDHQAACYLKLVCFSKPFNFECISSMTMTWHNKENVWLMPILASGWATLIW